MKQKIHPTYYKDATITCSCGKVYITGDTVQSTHIELCSACHPFYTGEQKVVDTANRVKRFEKLKNISQQISTSNSKKDKKKKNPNTQHIEGNKAITLKDMLNAVQQGNE